MSNNINYDSMPQIIKAVKSISELVKPTYGGAGTNVIIESKFNPGYETSNDAQTIVQALNFTEPEERVAEKIIKEVCDKADKVSGNGRKTTILLADELLDRCYNTQKRKIELLKELEALIPQIEHRIDLKTQNTALSDVEKIATTASESEETGRLFQEIYNKIGINGLITIESTSNYDTFYRITEGIRFEQTGYISDALINDQQTKKVVLEKPLILVTKKKIQTDDDINPLLVEMERMGNRQLVIFTDDMDANVVSLLIDLHKSGRFQVCIIKAPVLWKQYVFEDFAKCVGATIIEDSQGKNFKNMTLSDLGTCGRIEVDSEDTVITDPQDITDHIRFLTEQGTDDSKLRLSWLTGKTALLKMGGNTHQDLAYKRKKANDANRSVYLALKYGMVKGGGVCLYEIAQELPDDNILKEVLKAPLLQSANNYGMTPEEYIAQLSENIVDASMVVKRAVRNAIGIASTVMTAPSLVYIPKKTPEEIAYEVATKQNNPFQ